MKSIVSCVLMCCAAMISHAQCPSAFSLTGGGVTICFNKTTPITLSGSEVGVTYQLQERQVFPVPWDDVGDPVPGTGAPLVWNVTPDTYQVIAIKSGCSNRTMANTVTVSGLPVPPATTMTSSNNCALNATISLDYSYSDVTYRVLKNGLFTGVARIGVDGPLDITGVGSGTGTYTVEGVYANGCTSIMMGSVFLNGAPSVYSVSTSSSSICHGGDATIDLEDTQVGVSYRVYETAIFGSSVGEAVVGTGEPMTITFEPAYEGPYKIKATTAAGCSRDMSGTVSYTTTPSGTAFSVSANKTCADNAVITLSDSESDKYYYLETETTSSMKFGTGGALTWTVNNGGTYWVRVYNSSTFCDRKMPGRVILQQAPTNYVLSGSCLPATGGRITLQNSQPGFSYQLRSNLNGNVGTPVVSSSAAAIPFDVNPTYVETFSVIATDPGNGCTRTMGPAVVFPSYTPFDVTSNKVCANNATITLSNSRQNVNYKLMYGSPPSQYGSSIAGNTSPISWTNVNLDQTFWVESVHPLPGCSKTMNGTVTLYPMPQLKNTIGNTTICQGLSTPITLTETQPEMIYQLKKSGIFGYDNVGSPVAGAAGGGSLSFSVQPESNATYKVTAINPVATSCQRDMDNTPSINVTPTSPVYSVTASTPCQESTSITMNGSLSGVNYILTVGGTGLPQTGNGGALTWSNLPVSGTYSVAAHPSNGCAPRAMSGTGTIHPRPELTVTPSGSTLICSGHGIYITASTPVANPQYLWSTGETTPTISATNAGAYLVTLTDPATTCTKTDSSRIEVFNGSTGTISVSGNVCTGWAELTASTYSSASNFKWSTGATTRRITITQPGTYTVKYKVSFIGFAACRRFTCASAARYTTEEKGPFDDYESEITAEPALSVFPNPANDHITVLLSAPAEKTEEVVLLDATGSVVRTEYILKSEQQKDIPTAELKAGLYFVVVSDMGMKWYMKVMVEH